MLVLPCFTSSIPFSQAGRRRFESDRPLCSYLVNLQRVVNPLRTSVLPCSHGLASLFAPIGPGDSSFGTCTICVSSWTTPLWFARSPGLFAPKLEVGIHPAITGVSGTHDLGERRGPSLRVQLRRGGGARADHARAPGDTGNQITTGRSVEKSRTATNKTLRHWL